MMDMCRWKRDDGIRFFFLIAFSSSKSNDKFAAGLKRIEIWISFRITARGISCRAFKPIYHRRFDSENIIKTVIVFVQYSIKKNFFRCFVTSSVCFATRKIYGFFRIWNKTVSNGWGPKKAAYALLRAPKYSWLKSIDVATASACNGNGNTAFALWPTKPYTLVSSCQLKYGKIGAHRLN